MNNNIKAFMFSFFFTFRVIENEGSIKNEFNFTLKILLDVTKAVEKSLFIPFDKFVLYINFISR